MTFPATDARLAPRQSWLLLFNCQAVGLANCLNLLCSQICVEHYDLLTFDMKESLVGRLDSFDRIIIAPQLAATFADELEGRENVWKLPSILFDSYHPDLVHLTANGHVLKGPLGGFQSAIAYSAFRAGLNVQQTVALFTEETYRELGYFSRWDGSRMKFIDGYLAYGFDMSAFFIGWSRGGCFMYTPNHPKIACLRDLAKAILARARLDTIGSEFLPHDNLANGVVFPVYPEVGERLGVRGDHLFKLGGKYEFLGLAQFVEQSFDLYRASAPAAPLRQYEGLVAKAMSTIGASR